MPGVHPAAVLLRVVYRHVILQFALGGGQLHGHGKSLAILRLDTLSPLMVTLVLSGVSAYVRTWLFGAGPGWYFDLVDLAKFSVQVPKTGSVAVCA